MNASSIEINNRRVFAVTFATIVFFVFLQVLLKKYVNADNNMQDTNIKLSMGIYTVHFAKSQILEFLATVFFLFGVKSFVFGCNLMRRDSVLRGGILIILSFLLAFEGFYFLSYICKSSIVDNIMKCFMVYFH